MFIEADMACATGFGLLPDCDCPHEHWHVGQGRCCLDIHFESDGSCHVLLLGDESFEDDTTFTGLGSIDEARPLALAWAAPKIGEVL